MQTATVSSRLIQAERRMDAGYYMTVDVEREVDKAKVSIRRAVSRYRKACRALAEKQARLAELAATGDLIPGDPLDFEALARAARIAGDGGRDNG